MMKPEHHCKTNASSYRAFLGMGLLLLGCLFFLECAAPGFNTCSPGNEDFCACPDGSTGKRSCQPDGLYSVCQCTSGPAPKEPSPQPDAAPSPEPNKPEATPEPATDAGPTETKAPGPEPVADTAPDLSQPEPTPELAPIEKAPEKGPSGQCDENNPCPAGKGACIQGACTCLYSKKLATFTGHKGWASDVAFSPNGKYLASVSVGSEMRIWDLGTRKNTPLHTPSAARETRGVAFFPDSDLVVNEGFRTRWPSVFSIKDKRNITSLLGRGHGASTTDLTIRPDGAFVVTSAEEKKLILWNLTACVDEYKKRAAKPDYDGKATFCHSPSQQPATFSGLPANALAVEYSPDGKTLAACLENKEILLFDSNWKITKPFPALSAPSNSIVFHPNGKDLIVGTTDGKIMIGDTTTGKWTRTIALNNPLFPYEIHKVVIRADGKYIASGWSDRTAKIHDFATGKLIEVIAEHKGSVYGLDFSKDGKLLATASGDGVARLWGCQ